MSDIAIKVENLSKQYRLGTVGTGTISHDLNRWWHLMRGKPDPYLMIGESNDRTQKGESDYVWALKDIDFEVKQGEILGIIGKNGAGKSTLLKILSQVTSPTTGSVRAKGRVASLLEVGTGFHPELTGRENIYLNGTILGMSKREVTAKLEEIIEFAGVAKYVDTPVKRYSSGMMVRLGFAVAAHLEPEILIVDEVLAVGDAEFQKKAIGKMQEVSQGGGRTVLFVSHNMSSIKKLCTRGILMKNGSIEYKGLTEDVIDYYQGIRQHQTAIPLSQRKDRQGDGMITLTSVWAEDSLNNPIDVFQIGQTMRLFITCDNQESATYVSIAIAIYRNDGVLVTTLGNEYTGHILYTNNGLSTYICEVPDLALSEGVYTLNIAVRINNTIQDWITDAFIFSVENADFFGTGILPPKGHEGVLFKHKWSLK